MREALWLCLDRLCHVHSWRDAEIEEPTCSDHYQMDAVQKKRFQEAAEYLDASRFAQKLESSYRYISRRQPLTGQMLADWFSAGARRLYLRHAAERQGRGPFRADHAGKFLALRQFAGYFPPAAAGNPAGNPPVERGEIPAGKPGRLPKPSATSNSTISRRCDWKM